MSHETSANIELIFSGTTDAAHDYLHDLVYPPQKELRVAERVAEDEIFYDDILPDRSEKPHDAGRWTVDISAAFAKSVQKLDKKLQGRILVALLDLFKAPDVRHGDTLKPLDGDRKGEWRYRIGDYRLIYRPDRTRRTVLLIDVAARGAAYD